MDDALLKFGLTAFATLLVVVDPFGVLPIFTSLAKPFTGRWLVAKWLARSDQWELPDAGGAGNAGRKPTTPGWPDSRSARQLQA